METIVTEGAPVLREKAAVIDTVTLPNTEITELLKKMERALNDKVHGVALAAPQVGVPLRIFIVAEKVGVDMGAQHLPLVYINPTITKRSKEHHLVEEGCLSIPRRYGKVSRAAQVTIEAYNAEGKKFERGAGGLLAQIFQHEIDHLDGVLYTDKAENVYETEEIE